MLALMSPKLWIAVFLAFVLAGSHFFALRTGKAIVRGQWDAQRLEAEQHARAEESRRQTIVNKEASDAQARIAKLEADVAGARAGADRLRAAVSSAINTAKNPSAPLGGSGKSGADTLDVLALVLSRSDDAAGRLGEYADRLKSAGLACERIVDGLQPKP